MTQTAFVVDAFAASSRMPRSPPQSPVVGRDTVQGTTPRANLATSTIGPPPTEVVRGTGRQKGGGRPWVVGGARAVVMIMAGVSVVAAHDAMAAVLDGMAMREGGAPGTTTATVVAVL